MPEQAFRITSPDGRSFRVKVPEGVTREQVMARLPEIIAAVDPGSVPDGGPDGVPQIGVARQGRGLGEGRAPLTLPFGLGQFSVGGLTADAARGLSSMREEQTIPMAGATLAASFFPPLAAGRAAPLIAPALSRVGLGTEGLLGLLARGGTRFGPTVAAAGGGGAAAGGALEASRGGSPADVLSAAGRAGAEMAVGEAAGLGVGSAAARIAAPALGRMTDVGREALKFAREHTLPGSSRVITGREMGLPISPADVAPGGAQVAAQRIVDTLLPSRIVAQSRRRAVVNRVLEVPINEQNEIVRRLIRLDTPEAQLPQQIKVAAAVGRALGPMARRFGFEAADTGPRRFVSHVFERANAQQLDRVRRRMGARQFEDALTLNLSGLIERSVVVEQGRRVIDGERLLSVWRNLPSQTQNLYTREVRDAIEGLGAYAAVHRKTPELAAQPTLAFGPGVVTTGLGMAPQVVSGGLGAAADFGTPGIGAGVSLLVARSLMNPKGWLNRWLTNETLPSGFTQAIGSQATRFETRRRAAGLLEDEE